MHVLRLSAEEPFAQNPISFHFQRANVVIEAERMTIVDDSQRIMIVFAIRRALPDATRPVLDVPERALLPAQRVQTDPDPLGLRDVIVLRGYWLSRRAVPTDRKIAGFTRPKEIAAQFCEAWISGDDCLLNDDGGTADQAITPVAKTVMR